MVTLSTCLHMILSKPSSTEVMFMSPMNTFFPCLERLVCCHITNQHKFVLFRPMDFSKEACNVESTHENFLWLIVRFPEISGKSEEIFNATH